MSVSANLVARIAAPGMDGQLKAVEKALLAAVSSEDPFLTEVASHLASAGGKRLRPALVLAAATAAGAEVDAWVVQGAVSVELVHLGSLYHDDVIDAAESRRGVPSVNHRWGNLVAILAGDFLLARASELAARLGTEVAALLANTISRLCEGEVSQLKYAFDPERPEEAYMRAVAGKTASLLSAASRIGALVTDSSEEAVTSLTSFGRCFGMLFQVWDDIRDLVSTEEELGKPAGHDMVEGTYTLPVLRALSTPGVGGELRDLLGGDLDPPDLAKARDLILGTDAVAYSAAEARRWADRSAAALEPLASGPGGEVVEALRGLGHALLDELVNTV